MLELAEMGLRVHLTGGLPGATAILVLGSSRTMWNHVPLPLPLDCLGLHGCSLLASVNAVCPAMTGSTGKERGYTFVDVPLHAPAVTPLTMHAQWFVFPSQRSIPVGTSEGLSFRVRPPHMRPSW